jgi:hypothetical protein
MFQREFVWEKEQTAADRLIMRLPYRHFHFLENERGTAPSRTRQSPAAGNAEVDYANTYLTGNSTHFPLCHSQRHTHHQDGKIDYQDIYDFDPKTMSKLVVEKVEGKIIFRFTACSMPM